MMHRRLTFILLFVCLLLALSGCGNKGPLVPADDEEWHKTQKQRE
jgi:predicted small lipoprotein YifL